VARYGGDIDWGRPGAWVYLVAMLLELAMGVAGLLLERRAGQAVRERERNVVVFGADVARWCIEAGLVDEILVHAGSGARDGAQASFDQGQ